MAAVAHYAIVDSQGSVNNVTEWDGTTPWSPPAGYTAVEVTDQTGPAQIGATYSGGKFSYTLPASPQLTSLGQSRNGTFTVGIGLTSVKVTFPTPMPTASYTLVFAPDPGVTSVTKAADGFTIALPALVVPMSVDYQATGTD